MSPLAQVNGEKLILVLLDIGFEKKPADRTRISACEGLLRKMYPPELWQPLVRFARLAIKQCTTSLASTISRVGTERVVPIWANTDKIVDIYKECRNLTKRTGIEYQVDHIVPLNGKQVCGLHCESNLQIIKATDNRKKSNKHEA